jgi:hypothetical protein
MLLSERRRLLHAANNGKQVADEDADRIAVAHYAIWHSGAAGFFTAASFLPTGLPERRDVVAR